MRGFCVYLSIFAFALCWTSCLANRELPLNEPIFDSVITEQLYTVGLPIQPAQSTIHFLLTVTQGFARFQVASNSTNFTYVDAHKVDSANSQLIFNLAPQPGQIYVVRVFPEYEINLQPPQYSIVATIDSSVQLYLDAPQFVQLHIPDVQDFYFVHNWNGNASTDESFYCMISNEIEANYSIYATFDGSLPSPTHNQWNSSSYDVDEWRHGVYWGEGSPSWPSGTTSIIILIHLESTSYNTHCPLIVTATAFSPSEPLLVHLQDGQETPVIHLRGDTYAHLSFNTSTILSKNLFLSAVKETGSLIIYGFSPDDTTQQWPDATHYTSVITLDWWTDANSTTLTSTSAGLWRFTAVNTQLMNPNSSTLFAVVVSSFETPIAIPSDEFVAGSCSDNLKAVYSLVIPDVNHTTNIFVRPADPLSFMYQAGVRVIINKEPHIQPNRSIIDHILPWHDSVYLGGGSGSLRKCDEEAAHRDEPCILYIQVSCNMSLVTHPVNFLISAQRRGDVMPVDFDDELPTIRMLNAEASHFSIAIPNDHYPLYVATIPCHGRSNLYASMQTRYPSNSSTAAFKSELPNSVNWVLVSHELLKPNGTTMYVSVKAVGDSRSDFILRTRSYDPSLFTPLVAPKSVGVKASNTTDVVGRLIARWMPPSLSPQLDPTGQYDIIYDVYATVWDDTDAPAYFTRCGWTTVRVLPITVLNSALTPAADGYVEMNLDDLNSDDGEWVINVIATFVNMTGGRNVTWYEHELVYSETVMLPNTGPVPSPEEHHHVDGAEIAEILAAIFIPLFMVSGGVAYWFHRRNKRLQEELSLQLPDIESIDTMVTPANERRRGGRGPQSRLLDNDSLSGL